MTTSAARVRLTLGLLAVVAAFLLEARGLGPAARLAPVAVGLPLLLVLGMVLALDVADWRRDRGCPARSDHEALGRSARERATFGSLAGLLGLVALFGMAAGPAVYVYLELRLRAREDWRLAAASALVLWLVLYFGLGESLGVPLFEGLWNGAPGAR